MVAKVHVRGRLRGSESGKETAQVSYEGGPLLV